MKCLVLGGILLLFSLTLILTTFLPPRAIIFVQALIMLFVGLILLKK